MLYRNVDSKPHFWVMGLQGLFIFIIMLFLYLPPQPPPMTITVIIRRNSIYSVLKSSSISMLMSTHRVYSPLYLCHYFLKVPRTQCFMSLVFILSSQDVISGAFLSHGVLLPSHGVKHDMFSRSSVAQLVRISDPFMPHQSS